MPGENRHQSSASLSSIGGHHHHHRLDDYTIMEQQQQQAAPADLPVPVGSSLQELYGQLVQKERDLLLAAQLGKALLEKNEELGLQNEKMAEEYSRQLEVSQYCVFYLLPYKTHWKADANKRGEVDKTHDIFKKKLITYDVKSRYKSRSGHGDGYIIFICSQEHFVGFFLHKKMGKQIPSGWSSVQSSWKRYSIRESIPMRQPTSRKLKWRRYFMALGIRTAARACLQGLLLGFTQLPLSHAVNPSSGMEHGRNRRQQEQKKTRNTEELVETKRKKKG